MVKILGVWFFLKDKGIAIFSMRSKSEKSLKTQDDDIFISMSSALMTFVEDASAEKVKYISSLMTNGTVLNYFRFGELYIAIHANGISEEISSVATETLKFLKKNYSSQLSNWDGNRDAKFILDIGSDLEKTFSFKKEWSKELNPHDFTLGIPEFPCSTIDLIEENSEFYRGLGEHKRAINYVLNAAKIMKKNHKNCNHFSRMYSLAGLNYQNMQKYFKSWLYLQMGYLWGRKQNNPIAIVDAYHGFAKIKIDKNEFNKALKNLNHAMEYIDRIEDENIKLLRTLNLELTRIMLYRRRAEKTPDEKKRKKMYEDVISMYEKNQENINNLSNIISKKGELLGSRSINIYTRFYNNWGVLYSFLDPFNKEYQKSAIRLYLKALKMAEKFGIAFIFLYKQNIGESFALISAFETSKKYLDSALEIAKKCGSPSEIAFVKKSIGVEKILEGDFKKNKSLIENGIKIIEDALKDLKEKYKIDDAEWWRAYGKKCLEEI